MEFAEILENIGRRAPDAGDAPGARRGGSPADFWRVLDGLERNAGVDGQASQAAYRSNGAGAPDRDAASPPSPSVSLDPDDIAFELALTAATCLEDLKTARRLFARANHPDRVAPALRDHANRRMTIANALIDEAARRFAR